MISTSLDIVRGVRNCKPKHQDKSWKRTCEVKFSSCAGSLGYSIQWQGEAIVFPTSCRRHLSVSLSSFIHHFPQMPLHLRFPMCLKSVIIWLAESKTWSLTEYFPTQQIHDLRAQPSTPPSRRANMVCTTNYHINTTIVVGTVSFAASVLPIIIFFVFDFSPFDLVEVLRLFYLSSHVWAPSISSILSGGTRFYVRKC